MKAKKVINFQIPPKLSRRFASIEIMRGCVVSFINTLETLLISWSLKHREEQPVQKLNKYNRIEMAQFVKMLTVKLVDLNITHQTHRRGKKRLLKNIFSQLYKYPGYLDSKHLRIKKTNA